MATYELTTGTREEFEAVQTQLISDFAAQVINAEVYTHNIGYGRVVDCLNTTNNFESIVLVVYFDAIDMTKKYSAGFAINCGGLVFTDKSLVALYGSFREEQYKLKAQYNKAVEDAQRREKENKKKADQLKKAEAKNQLLKEKAIRDFDELAQKVKTSITETDEFYYNLGWLAAHVGSVSATMPDYLDGAFVKHFGDEAVHRVVDSKKRTVNGNSMQWTFGFKATLKNLDSVPDTLTKYLNSTGKAIANTSFLWSLVSDYGFVFGKKQNVDKIMATVPEQYWAVFEAGLVG